MTSLRITRRLTTDTGRINKQAAREQIAYEVATHRISIRDAAQRTRNSLNYELWDVNDKLAQNAAFEANRQIEREDAHDLAARYGFDEGRLMFERNYWHGKVGSRFGADKEYERFCRALKLTRAKQIEAA